MAQIKVKSGTTIDTEITVPGDKSISHRAIMFAGISNGTCTIDGFLPSEDCLATIRAMCSMGVSIKPDQASDLGFGPTRFEIEGKGLHLSPPSLPIECGNSGTTMRLISGILSGQNFRSELQGDSSLSARPMSRIVTPLTQMNARITATGKRQCAPLVIDGQALNPISYELPVASAQVKSAILLAGLYASGKTTVIEPVLTRDHTERMLRFFKVNVERDGNQISIEGGQVPTARDFVIPGDISSAAFWIVAAAASPGAHLVIRHVGLNPTRTGVLKVLRRMGAQITETITHDDGELAGDIEVKGSALEGTEIGGDEIPNIIDELPILAVAGAIADGQTVIRDAHELKVKETDRIHAVVTNLRAIGAFIRETPDGMIIEGGKPLYGAKVGSFGDHRIAMAFAIAGLFTFGEMLVDDTDCINTSYPGFEKDLLRLTNISS